MRAPRAPRTPRAPRAPGRASRRALRGALVLGLVLPVAPAWPAAPAYALDALPAFTASVRPIDAALEARMSYSWQEGCPVALSGLRYVRVTHVRFDGTARQGELVVRRGAAADVVTVFRELYAARFPIRRMRLVDDYRGSDDASMAANNTSAFNCRRVTGGGSWSEHSYGRAVDVNPVQNPYVSGTTVAPPAGEAYVTRSPRRKGMVSRAVRDAFAAVGWEWGGAWTSRKDYQHFSSTGR